MRKTLEFDCGDARLGFGRMTTGFLLRAWFALARFAWARSALAALSIATPAVAGDLTLLVHTPQKPSAHPPLIVLLHGSGADEHDMITMWRDLPENFIVVAPRGPFAHGGGFVWYRKNGAGPRQSDIALSRKIVDLVVDEAARRFDADRRRIYIGGFSQGAVMSYAIALQEPGRFRGAVVLSGMLFSSASAGAKPGTAFFIGHGTSDRRIPFSAAVAARETLAARGAAVTFHAYPGMGHGTNAAEMRDLSAWLAADEADRVR